MGLVLIGIVVVVLAMVTALAVRARRRRWIPSDERQEVLPGSPEWQRRLDAEAQVPRNTAYGSHQ